MTTKTEQNAAAIEKMTGEFLTLAKAADAKDGAVKFDGRDVFESNLPETVTPKIIADLQNHVTNTATAAHAAIGEIGIAAMAKDKDLDKFVGTVALGPIGSMKSYISREHIGRNPSTQEETKTIGANRASLDIFTPGGQRFNAAREAIKTMAVEKLK